MSAILQVTLCSPGHLLQIILQDILISQENFLEKTFPCIDHTHISLLKSRFQNSKGLLKRTHKKTQLKATQLTYLSAVPHQICAYANICAVAVANILAAQISGYKSDRVYSQIPAGLLDHIHIKATPSGYLEFRIGDGAIAQWLTSLTQPIASLFGSPALSSDPVTRSHPNLFSIQHAHARCCSLLRIAAQRQIIGLNWLEEPSHWQWAQPHPISWLTMEEQLHTCHASERQLIHQCFTVLDELPWRLDPLPENIQSLSLHSDRIATLAQDLAQAFHTMHRQCQVWGAVQNQGRDRLTAHLAIILVTQRLLYGLLQIGLGAIAPAEL